MSLSLVFLLPTWFLKGGAPCQIFPSSFGLSIPLSTHRFINARRRILQPMLDSSCSETPKTKKKPAQNRPVQRFWPDSLASGVAQAAPSELAMSEGASLQMGKGGSNGPGTLL